MLVFFFFKQKTAYEMAQCDWSSDVCSSDLESQRGLAELLLAQGRVDEAERFALAARETVGPHDVTSLSTTTMSLGLVRAAQGLDDEAEQLLLEAYETISGSEHRLHQVETLESLTQFYRERD